MLPTTPSYPTRTLPSWIIKANPSCCFQCGWWEVCMGNISWRGICDLLSTHHSLTLNKIQFLYFGNDNFVKKMFLHKTYILQKLNHIIKIINQTRRACASERSCKIWVIVIVVPGGKQRPILPRSLRSKWVFLIVICACLFHCLKKQIDSSQLYTEKV